MKAQAYMLLLFQLYWIISRGISTLKLMIATLACKAHNKLPKLVTKSHIEDNKTIDADELASIQNMDVLAKLTWRCLQRLA
ncbi:MAG TPA: hypothetical protein DDW91_18385 [Shewanella frigidimarina]|nr:hypothetical protein [Shewanella frigidimarina]